MPPRIHMGIVPEFVERKHFSVERAVFDIEFVERFSQLINSPIFIRKDGYHKETSAAGFGQILNFDEQSGEQVHLLLFRLGPGPLRRLNRLAVGKSFVAIEEIH